MSHLYICPMCGEYFSPTDVTFDIGTIIDSLLFLDDETRKNKDAVTALKAAGFTLLVSFQDLLDCVDTPNVTNGTDESINQWNTVSISYDTAIELLKKNAKKISLQADRQLKELLSEDEDAPISGERVLELFQRLKWFKSQNFTADVATAFRGNLIKNKNATAEFKLYVSVVGDTVKVVKAKDVNDEELHFGRRCPYCGGLMPKSYTNGKIVPILLLGSQQCGKTSLAAAFSSLASGGTVRGKKLLLNMEGPSHESPEREYYDNNKASYKHGYEVEKTPTDSLNKAPMSFLSAKYGDGEDYIFPIVDLPGEKVAYQQNGMWRYPLAEGNNDIKIHQIAKRAEYIIFCVDTRTLTGVTAPMEYNLNVQLDEMLLKTLEVVAQSNPNLKGIYIALTAMDVYHGDKNAQGTKEYNDFYLYWNRDVPKLGELNDANKSLEIMLNSYQEQYNPQFISEMTKRLIEEMPSGKSFLNIVNNISDKLGVPVSLLPLAAYGVKPYRFEQRKAEWIAEAEAALASGDVGLNKEALQTFLNKVKTKSKSSEILNDFCDFKWESVGVHEKKDVRKNNVNYKSPLLINYLLYRIINDASGGTIFPNCY